MLVEFPLATRALILWAIVEKKHGSRIHALFCSVLDLLIRHEMWVLFILIYPFMPYFGHIFLLFLWLVVESSRCVFSPPSKTSSFSVVSSHPLSFHFFLFPSPSVHVESPFKNKFLHSPKPPTPIFHCNWWLCQLVTVCACAMNVCERQSKFYCYIFLVNRAFSRNCLSVNRA